MRVWLVLALAAVPAIAAGGAEPPAEYVDEGACPFECCVYRTWTTKADTTLYARPEDGAALVGAAKAGVPVEALTGEVRTKVGRFLVKKPQGPYRPGDVVFVYTYEGEGEFKVWRDGVMQDEDLGFSPYGGTTGTRCELHQELCWGTLEEELQSTWWVKVRTRQGVEGWTRETDHFGNMDACGID